MQLDLTAEVLVLLGVVVVALVVLAIVIAVGRRSRSAPAASVRTVADAVAVQEPSPSPAVAPTGGRRPDVPDRYPGEGLSPAERIGSSRAVVQALTQRAAADQSVGDGAVDPAPVVGPGGDARDRLLSVLLDHPALAVGAAAELEVCRAELERLSGEVRAQRDALGRVLGRLTVAGLVPEQLGRLSGLPVHEVQEMLAPASAGSVLSSGSM